MVAVKEERETGMDGVVRRFHRWAAEELKQAAINRDEEAAQAVLHTMYGAMGDKAFTQWRREMLIGIFGQALKGE